MSTVKQLPVPDYETDDVLVVREPEQLRALAGDLRTKLVTLLRERARSTTDLAGELGLPKGTVGHHLKVLERAGLVRVVRTRQVRALTEKYYGRTARLFVIKGVDTAPDDAGATVGQAALRIAAEEMQTLEGDDASFASVHVRLTKADARRFARRIEKLVDDLRAAERAGGDLYGIVATIYGAER